MLHVPEVRGGMFVFGRVTAADVTARETEPEMDPCISHLKAFFAPFAARRDFVNLIQVFAFLCHKFFSC